jgi:hypothetical protein
VKKEKTQISKIRNAKWEITTNTMEILEIIRYLQTFKTEPRGY